MSEGGAAVAVLSYGLLCAVLGLLVPALISRIPEPPREPATERDGEPAEPKEPYADVARLPGLAWKAALAG